METLSYLLLGLVQGLTEFLPVSSSGHLTLGQSLLGLGDEDLTFTVLVHAATALSTVVVFRKDMGALLRDVARPGESGRRARHFTGLLLLSAVPAAVVGLGFKDAIEALATGSLSVPCCVSPPVCCSFPTRLKRPPSRWSMAGVGHRPRPSLCHFARHQPFGKHHRGRLMLGVSGGSSAVFLLMALIPIGGATLLTLKDLLEQPSTADLAGGLGGLCLGHLGRLCERMGRLHLDDPSCEAQQLAGLWRLLLGGRPSRVDFWVNALR